MAAPPAAAAACLVVPGLLGSVLLDVDRVPARVLWDTGAALRWRLGLAGVAPELGLEGAPGEPRDPPGRAVEAGGLLAAAYAPLVDGLRARLGVPVELVPYDWRRSVREAAARLAARIAAVLAGAARGSGVDLVAHSLGGLVVRALPAAWRRLGRGALPVRRVAYLATPHAGTLDAMEALVRGESGLLGGRKALRKVARTFPSLYELLPTYRGAVVGPRGRPLDPFDLLAWQENVREGSGDPRYCVRASALAAARRTLDALAPPLGPVGGDPARALAVYVREPRSTLERVTARSRRGRPRPWLDFEGAERGEGDGTVLAASARAGGLAAVELRPQDASVLREWKARWISAHAFLPTLDEVHTVVARHLEGRSGPALLPRGLDAGRYRPPRRGRGTPDTGA